MSRQKIAELAEQVAELQTETAAAEAAHGLALKNLTDNPRNEDAMARAQSTERTVANLRSEMRLLLDAAASLRAELESEAATAKRAEAVHAFHAAESLIHRRERAAEVLDAALAALKPAFEAWAAVNADMAGQIVRFFKLARPGSGVEQVYGLGRDLPGAVVNASLAELDAALRPLALSPADMTLRYTKRDAYAPESCAADSRRVVESTFARMRAVAAAEEIKL